MIYQSLVIIFKIVDLFFFNGALDVSVSTVHILPFAALLSSGFSSIIHSRTTSLKAEGGDSSCRVEFKGTMLFFSLFLLTLLTVAQCYLIDVAMFPPFHSPTNAFMSYSHRVVSKT